MELPIEQVMQQGVAAHKEGKLKDAERLYRAILQSHPEHPEANHNLGILAVSVNKGGEALPFFKTALEANPKVEQFWLSYIEALIKKEDYKTAKKIIAEGKEQEFSGDKLISLEVQLSASADGKVPPHAATNNLLEYYQSGRYAEAEKLAASITKEFPGHPFAWKILGAVLMQTDRVEASLSATQKSVHLAPQDPNAHNNLGITLQEIGRLDEAEGSYRRAIALSPDYADAHYNLGITLKNLSRLEEAEASYTQAIHLQADFAEAHNNLGNTLKELRRFDEAESSYRQAISLKSGFVEAHKNLGVMLQEQARLEDAVSSLKQAIVLNPNYADLHGDLGVTLNAMGLKDSALQHFERNLQLKRGINSSNLLHNIFTTTSNAKIEHDIEQFKYLADSGYDVKKFIKLVALYKLVQSELNYTLDTDILLLSDKHQKLIGDSYNRPIHILSAPTLKNSPIGGNLDVNKITEDYFSHEFGLTYFDEFLSPTALDALQTFLLGSTIWFDFNHDGGYMGAYLSDGLASPLVLQIAEDIKTKLPKIFKHYHLTQLWAYKYNSRACNTDNSYTGIKIHADSAAINVNFWITPNSANLDISSGGLIVYNTEAPLDWDFRTYNNYKKNKGKIKEVILKGTNKRTIIPYNQNRVVIFNSNLFHETDKIIFKDGYENRRINITMLFGKRGL